MKINTYSLVVPFKEEDKGKWGFKNPFTNKIMIEPIYDEAEEFIDGYACVVYNGYYGFINKENEFVIPPIYNYAENLGGHFEVHDDNGKNIIDIYGLPHLTPKIQDGLCGYVDYEDNLVIPLLYEEASEFSEGLAAVKQDGKWGYINGEGKIIIPFQFARAETFSEGFAVVEGFEYYKSIWDESAQREVRHYFQKQNIDDTPEDLGSWKVATETLGYINKKGELLKVEIGNDLSIIRADSFSEGRAHLKCYNNEWYNEHFEEYYIDTEGKIIIKLGESARGESFSCGKAAVSNHLNQWGYINLEGKLVIPYQYQEFALMDFKDGYAIVKKNNLYGRIDMNGKEVVPCIYESFLNKELY